MHEHTSDAAFWDQKYQHHHHAWDPDPNPILAAEVAALPPGAALDVACGEGSDAVWLARRGWRVTALDFSQVALERGRAADEARQVTWVCADVLAWQPDPAGYDLVTTHFLHFPPADRPRLFARLAGAVRPGGTLLVVAHHPSDLERNIGRPPLPELFFTAEEVAAALEPGGWEVLAAEARPRPARDRDGQPVTIHDTVLKARRLT